MVMKNYPNLISAEIVADSLNQYQERITTFKLVFPRYILAELNTHRLFSKNSASSRAIPFRKMVKSVLENPFIPIAFQKAHIGMQGTEYLDKNVKLKLPQFLSVLSSVFKYKDDREIDSSIFNLLEEIYKTNRNKEKTLIEWWLYCRDKAVKCAILMASLGVTKQLCNRLLEPFLYHTVLLTATEFENFFELRCPKYIIPNSKIFENQTFKNKQDIRKAFIKENVNEKVLIEFNKLTELEHLQYNKGAADIHIMDLAEKMYDAYNESEPVQLKENDWHIPFSEDKTDLNKLADLYKPTGSYDPNNPPPDSYYEEELTKIAIKIATARCARISYKTLGDNPVIDYEKDIKLHDDLLAMKHFSPFEHCAKVMNKDEYFNHIKTEKEVNEKIHNIYGWSRNFKGFQQYREIIENE